MVCRDRGKVFLVAATITEDHFCPALFPGQGGANDSLGGRACAPADLRVACHCGDVAVGPSDDLLSGLLFACELIQHARRFALPVGETLGGDQLVDVARQATVDRSQGIGFTDSAALLPILFACKQIFDPLFFTSRFFDDLHFDAHILQTLNEAWPVSAHADCRINCSGNPQFWDLVRFDLQALSLTQILATDTYLPLMVRGDRYRLEAHSVGR